MKRSILAVAIAACGAQPPAPVTEPRPGQDVRIVTHDELLARTKSQRAIELPFGQSQNGTALMTALLQRARDAGATYVGDLAFHMVFKWRGNYVECETKVAFGDPPPIDPAQLGSDDAAGSGDDLYSSEVKSFVPHEMSFVADETDLKCKQVAYETEVVQRKYDSRFDVEIGEHIDKIPMETAMVTDHAESCAPEQVKRQTLRYDYQMRLDFVPPDWSYLGPTYAGGTLRESAPLCFAIDRASLGAQPVHRLTGTMGFRGVVEQKEPLKMPMPEAMPNGAKGGRRVH